MNRILLIACISLILTVSLASAAPIIQDVNLQPPYLWLGEEMAISMGCTDDANNTITQTYADITGPSLILPTLYFSGYQNYALTVDRNYFDRTGAYSANIYCTNDLSETSVHYASFTVSKLTGYVSAITPSPSYTGDVVEVDFMVKRNDVPITSGVIFNVSLDGDIRQLKIAPAYDTNRGWILKFDSPAAGLYSMKVTAFYDRSSTTNYSTLDARNSIEFNVEGIDKTWIKSTDNITVTLKALDRGSMMPISTSNTNIRIGSADATITSITQRGSLFDVRVIAPLLSSGSYQLEAFTSYSGNPYSSSRSIDYIVPISGKIVDINDKSISAQMEFLKGSTSALSLSTDSYGHYSGQLPPGTYDIRFTFPRSAAYLHGSSISSFDDPVKFFFSEEAAVIPGIRNAGLYDFEISLSYTTADLEMTYNEKNVMDEGNISLFRCDAWNSGRSRCNGAWYEVDGDFDIVRNKAKITSSTLAAFAVGEIKSIVSDFNTDKGAYSLNDMMKVSGITKDEDRMIVDNATVEAYVSGMLTVFRTATDSNGVFALTIPTPTEEGAYTLSLRIKKSPYEDFYSTKTFTVSKSKSLFIDFPDTVSIEKGTNMSQPFTISNTGQADMKSLNLSIDGISDEYYSIDSSASLLSGEKKDMQIVFHVPVYAQDGISSATLRLEGNNVTQEKIFGLNVRSKQELQENATPTTPTGMFTNVTLPYVSYTEMLYIALFAIASFSTVVILKKMRLKSDRSDVTKTLSNVKGAISGGNTLRNGQDRYDKVILTEFPNFMKFSKNLIKDDKNGKDY